MGRWIIYPFSLKKYNSLEIHRNYFKVTDDAFTVLLLGGSTSRELTDSDYYISELISERCSEKVRFINAGSSSQSYITSRSIYDYYSRRGVDLVLIGANYYRYILTNTDLVKNTLDNKISIPISFSFFLEEFPRNQNPPQVEPLYLAAKLISQRKNLIYDSNNLFNKSLPFEDKVGFNNLYKYPPLSLEKKKEKARLFSILRYEDFINFGAFGAESWNLFIDNAEKKDSKVIFIDLPKAPFFTNTTKLFESQMNKFLDSHLKNGAQVIRWKSSDLNLVENDFYDQQHLLKNGRKKIEPVLIELIANNIPNCKVK